MESSTNFPRLLMRRGRKAWDKRRMLLVLIPAALLLLIAVALLSFNLRYSSRVHPGVQALGVRLDGLNLDAAAAVLEPHARSYVSRPVQLQFGDKTVNVSGGELGLQIDPRGTAERALRVGRTGGILSQWTGRLDAWWSGQAVAPLVRMQNDVATKVVQDLAQGVDRPVKDASVELAADGPALHPSQTGLKIDVAATVARLPASLEALYAHDQPVAAVVLATEPAVREADLARTYELLSTVWSRPLQVSFQGRKWTMPERRVRSMVRLEGTGAEVRPLLDEGAIEEWVSYIAGKIDRAPKSAEMKVETGAVTLVRGHSGYEVDEEATLGVLKTAAFEGAGEIQPVVTATQPGITNDELRPAVEAADALIRRPLSLLFGERSWRLSTRQLTDLLAWNGIPPAASPYIEPEALESWVRDIATGVDREPRDARIRMKAGQVEVVADRAGLKVAIKDTLTAVQAALEDRSGTAALQTVAITPAVTAADLAPAAAEANTLIGEPVTLTLHDDAWTVSERRLRTWLRWRGEGAGLQPYLDPGRVRGFVRGVAEEAYKDPTDAYIDTDGETPRLVTEVPGLEVNTQATAERLLQLASTGERRGELVTRSVPPDVMAADLKPAYDRAMEWMSSTLELRLEGEKWSLGPDDLADTVQWYGSGAEIEPYVDDEEMVTKLQGEVVPDSSLRVAVDYTETAQAAEEALKDGRRTARVAHTHYPDLIDKTEDGHSGYEEYWGGDFPERWIDINLSSQTMAGYEDGFQVYVSYVTSGRPSLPTPTGTYSITAKFTPYKFVSPWPLGSPYWYESVTANFAVRFREGGFYIHDSPWRDNYGPGTNQAGADGGAFTGTHGCVALPYDSMEWLFYWAYEGTPVVIHW